VNLSCGFTLQISTGWALWCFLPLFEVESAEDKHKMEGT